MKTVKLTEILEYYDGIQIFVAQDPIGGHYVCEMIDTVDDFDRYAVVGVRPERLDDFQSGRVDLRTLLLESPGGEWYITIANGTIDDPLTLEPQQTPLADTDYLPESGYFLDDEPSDVAPAIQRALELGKVVAVAGQVEQVNRSAGEWGLLTDHGVKTGRVAPGGPDLDGLQVGTRYRFKCAEVSELDALWRDRKTLYLRSIEAAGVWIAHRCHRGRPFRSYRNFYPIGAERARWPFSAEIRGILARLPKPTEIIMPRLAG